MLLALIIKYCHKDRCVPSFINEWSFLSHYEACMLRNGVLCIKQVIFNERKRVDNDLPLLCEMLGLG